VLVAVAASSSRLWCLLQHQHMLLQLLWCQAQAPGGAVGTTHTAAGRLPHLQTAFHTAPAQIHGQCTTPYSISSSSSSSGGSSSSCSSRSSSDSSCCVHVSCATCQQTSTTHTHTCSSSHNSWSHTNSHIWLLFIANTDDSACRTWLQTRHHAGRPRRSSPQRCHPQTLLLHHAACAGAVSAQQQ
jgi:hypothetical protein